MKSQNSALKNLEIQLSQLTTLYQKIFKVSYQVTRKKIHRSTLRSSKNLDEQYTNGHEKNQPDQKVDEGKNVETPSKQLDEKEEKIIEKITLFPEAIPFPQNTKREKLDNQFAKFLDILKQIHINILFADALLQMPSYAKFLKEILSSKRNLEDVSVVVLTKKYSVILQNKLPQKLGDPDQSTKKPKGIIENVLARVDKFIFPVDFLVLEMEDCLEEPIILGRPILAIGRAIIDVHQGQLILTVDEEKVIFDMQKMLRFSGDETSSSCITIDMISDLADEFKNDKLILDSMERCLVKSGTP
ncbi:uncharacterized protein LOC132613130 [Lycium barbarum]|uniref:uncharacterized protein LOC132613130 n=1 Tax=Lycium barbarum TaxID=112863 RepID=UPI00293E93CD|nr:uncharacterized protein LOC132613130 [Lycium barbarum]